AAPAEGAEAAPAEPAPGTGPAAEAVGEALQMSGDRLARLMEALSVVGNRVGSVRLVRVLSGDKPPPNAQKRGDFFYVVDVVQKGQQGGKGRFEGRRGDRGVPGGGRDRGGPGGGRGPGGPGGGRGPGGPGGGRGPGGGGGFGG